MSAINRVLQKLQTGLKKQKQEFSLDQTRREINKQLRKVAIQEAVSEINADQGTVVDLDQGTGYIEEKQAEIANEAGLIGPAVRDIATGKQSLDTVANPEAIEKLNQAVSRARAAGLSEEAEEMASGNAAVGFLMRTLQILDSTGAFVRGTILEGESSDNILEEIGQRLVSGAENTLAALRGEETKTFTDHFEGVGPTIGGLGLDILTDPLTYLTLGATGVAKGVGTGVVKRVAREAAESGTQKAAKTLGDEVARLAAPKASEKAARRLSARVRKSFEKLAEDVSPEQFRELSERLTESGARGLRELTDDRALRSIPAAVRPTGIRAQVPFARRVAGRTGRTGVVGLTGGTTQPLRRAASNLGKVPGIDDLKGFLSKHFDFWDELKRGPDALNNEQVNQFVGAFRRSVARTNDLTNRAEEHLQALDRAGVTGSQIEQLGVDGVRQQFGDEAGEAIDFFQNQLADAAQEAGIEFRRLEDHFPHVIESPEIRDAIARVKKGSGGLPQGAGASFTTKHAQGRRLQGHVQDINEWAQRELGADLFSEDPITAYRVYSRSISRAIARREMANELTQAGVFKRVPRAEEVATRVPNPQEVPEQQLRQAEIRGMVSDLRRTLAEGRDEQGILRRIPEKAQEMVDRLEELKPQVVLDAGGREAGREARRFIEETQDVIRKLEEGWEVALGTKGDIALPEAARRFFSNTIDAFNPSTIAGRTYDRALSYFKATAIATPGFVGRNFWGILWQNHALAGAPFEEGMSTLNAMAREADGIIRYARTGVLDDIDDPYIREAYENLLVKTGQIRNEQFKFRRGLKRRAPTVKTREGEVVLNPLDRDFIVWRMFHTPQQAVEDWARLTLYRHARRSGASIDEATDLAGQYHFFYNELTPFERKWAKRAVPFYTWWKNNLKLQMTNLLNQPAKYKRLLDIQRAGESATGVDISEMPISERVRENIPIPIPGTGGPTLLNQDLPIRELAELPIPTDFIEKAATGQWGELTQDLGFRDRLAPFVELGVQVLSGRDPLGRGYSDNVKAPDWALTPGVRETLKSVGALQESPREGPVMPIGVRFAIEGLHPGLYRIRLMNPRDKEVQEKQLQSTISTLTGIGIRMRSEEEESRTLEQRAAEIRELTRRRVGQRRVESGAESPL